MKNMRKHRDYGDGINNKKVRKLVFCSLSGTNFKVWYTLFETNLTWHEGAMKTLGHEKQLEEPPNPCMKLLVALHVL